MSVYQDAGLLILGTRLKRISDRFLNEISRIYLKQNIRFETAWFPVLFLLDRKGSMSLTEISNELEVSHSAISQMINQLQVKKVVNIQPDDSDARIKRILLTERGKKLIEQVHPVWEALNKSIHRILPQNMDQAEFLEVLSFIEKQLNNNLLSETTLTYLNHRPDNIAIIEPDSRLTEKLTSWLKKEDVAYLPLREKLVLALAGDDIIGMAAFNFENNDVILYYLYVTPGQRRKGVGLKLIQGIHQKYNKKPLDSFRLNEANIDLVRVLIKSGYSFRIK
jgi:DNA-binding MarR family transcriptional regulator/GNAT superfamily N-acetyltransferase